MPWFAQGTDYLYFADGAAAFVLGLVAYLAERDRVGQRVAPQGLGFLALFGVLRGLTDWISIPVEALASAPILSAILTGGWVFSSLCLLEYGRLEVASRLRRVPGPWVHLPILLLVVAPRLAGKEIDPAWLRYVLVVPSAMIAAAGTWLRNDRLPTGRVWVPFGSALALSGVSLGLRPALDALLPNRSPGLLSVSLSGFFALLAAMHLLHGSELGRGASHGKALRLSLGVGSLTAVMLVGAGFFTELLGEAALRLLRAEASSRAIHMVDSVERRMEQADAVARLLATSPAVITRLQRREETTPDAVQDVLDRYARVWNGAVAYLLDTGGRVLSASDGRATDPRPGDNHAGLAYFRDALNRETGRQLETGTGPEDRHYYTAQVARSPTGEMVGVAALVRPESVTALLESGAGLAYLVDAGGTIYLSNDPHRRSGSLWPGSANTAGLATPMLGGEPADGEIVSLGGRAAVVTRRFAGPAGLSLVHVSDAGVVAVYRALALLVVSVTGAVGLAFLGDRTLRAAAAARLTASEARYRAVVDASPAWVTLLDSRGRVVLSNDHHTGFAGPLEPGAIYADIWPETARAEVLEALAASAAPPETSREILCPVGGAATIWRLTLTHIHTHGTGDPDAAMVALATDITDQRQAEQVSMIAQRLGGIGTLAAGVAHQFNNIHAGISGYVQLARRDPLGAETPRLLEAAARLLDRATEVTTRLLEFARPTPPGRVALRVGVLAHEVLVIMADELARERIEVVERIEDREPVSADPDRIKYVLVSLIDNARHVAALEEPRRITVRTHTRDGWLHLHVENSGPPIPREALSRLFLPFFTLKGEWAQTGSGLAAVQGYGLSLSVCHTIVTGHGGAITVQSEPGRDTAFRVLLPIGRVHTAT